MDESLFGPCIDGVHFPKDPTESVEEGSHWSNGLPIIIGTTRDEGTLLRGLHFWSLQFLTSSIKTLSLWSSQEKVKD